MRIRKQNQNFSERGFTIVEMLIVVGIISILSTMILANFRQGDRNKRVALGIDGVTSVVRLAQNYSLSGKQIPSNATAVSGTRCVGDNTASYYRVDFVASSSVMNVYAEDKCGAVFLMDDFTLASGARIQATNGLTLTTCLGMSCSSSNPNTLRIKFTPPFGRMTASTGAAYVEFSSADIGLETTSGGNPKSMRIDGVSGRIGN